MKKEDFAFICCRLLAIYWAYIVILNLSAFIISFASLEENLVDASPQVIQIVYFSLVPLILYSLAAIIFWFGSSRIAKLIVPPSSADSESNAISLNQAQSIAFSVVGILVLASALPEVGAVLYKFNLMKELDGYAKMLLDAKVHLVELSIRILLGVSLLFGARGLTGILNYIRNLSTK